MDDSASLLDDDGLPGGFKRRHDETPTSANDMSERKWKNGRRTITCTSPSSDRTSSSSPISGNNILPLFGGGFPGFNQEGFFSPEKGRGSTQSLKTWDTSREDELSQCSSAMSLQTEQPPIGGLPSLLAHSSSEEGQRESSNQPSGDKTCWNTNECVGDESACAWALIPKTPKKARRPVVQSSPRKKKFANAATMNYTTALPRSCLLAKFAIAIDAQTPALSATTGNTKQAHQGLSENTGRGAFRESGPSKQTLAQSRTPLGCENRPPQSLPEHASLTLANVVAPKKRTKRGAQTVCEFLHRNSLQPTICTSSLKHEYCQKRHALMEQLEMGQYPCEDEHGGLFPAPVIQPGSNPPRVLLRQKGFEERIAGLMHMRQLHLCHEKRAQREHQPYLLLFPDKNLTASPLARLLNSPKLHSGYFFGPDGKCQTDTCILVCNLFKHTSLSRLAMERGDIDQSDKVAFSSYVMWLFNLPMESELSTPFSKKGVRQTCLATDKNLQAEFACINPCHLSIGLRTAQQLDEYVESCNQTCFKDEAPLLRELPWPGKKTSVCFCTLNSCRESRDWFSWPSQQVKSTTRPPPSL